MPTLDITEKMPKSFSGGHEGLNGVVGRGYE